MAFTTVRFQPYSCQTCGLSNFMGGMDQISPSTFLLGGEGHLRREGKLIGLNFRRSTIN